MKILFRVTSSKISTLLRGLDFDHDSDFITFFEDEKRIPINYLGDILLNGKYGFVAFTTEEKSCKKLQHDILELEG